MYYKVNKEKEKKLNERRLKGRDTFSEDWFLN
jgi:hypothetical protein